MKRTVKIFGYPARSHLKQIANLDVCKPFTALS